jgi:CBS domain-containing protein
MTDKIVAVGPMEPIASAARLMKRHNLGALPVCDEAGHLRGMVTDRDIVTRCVASDISPEDTPVREIMTRGIRTCTQEQEVDAVAQTMGLEQLRRLPVVDDRKLVGMVTLCDLVRRPDYTTEAAQTLSAISTNIQRR